MLHFLFRTVWYFSFFTLLAFAHTGCRSDQHNNARQETYQQAQSDQYSPRRHKHHRDRSHSTDRNQSQSVDETTIPSGEVPAKVRKVLDYVRQYGRAPNGYVGGRTFGNYEGHLPKKTNSGDKIRYQEWDVNPKIQGRNRGTERLITGSDERAYFTRDHYNSFTEVK